MSVTFFAEAATPVISAVYDNRDGTFEPDGPAVVTSESTPFELNVANGNARWVVEAMGQEFDYVGSIPFEELETALNHTNGQYDSLAYDTIDGQYGDRYLLPLRDLILYCIHLKCPLVWA